MDVIIVFAVAAIFLVAPVMVGARLVKARNTGFGSALLAVVVWGVVSAVLDQFVTNDLIGVLAMTAVGVGIFSLILGTTFLRALGVSLFVTVVHVVLLMLIVSLAPNVGLQFN